MKEHKVATEYDILLRAINPISTLTDLEHDQLVMWDRCVYTHLLALPGLSPRTAMGIVVRLLAITGDSKNQPIADTTRNYEDRLIALTLRALPANEVLEGFAVLIARRVNNQRTSGCIRSYLFGHPQLSLLAVGYRRQMRQLLVHAMGQRVAKTCVHFLLRDDLLPRQHAYLNRHLFRYGDKPSIREVALFLFGKLKKANLSLVQNYLDACTDLHSGEGLPYHVLQGIAGTYHPRTHRSVVHRLAGSDKLKRNVEQEDPSELIGLLRCFLEERNADLRQEIDKYLDREAAKLPQWDIRLEVIADASISMQGVGYRRYNNLAITVAICELLRRRCKQYRTTWVGGSHADPTYPEPEGPTCLAPALLAAVQSEPDAVVVITDGFENIEEGDAARIYQGLRQLEVSTPIVQIIPAYTNREHLEGRIPLTSCPALVETAESGFMPFWLRLRAVVNPETLPVLLQEWNESVATC
jgi:hypothetical protein